MQITEKILREVFNRLLNTEPKDEVVQKLTMVVEGMMEKFQGTFELDTVQRQNTFRAIVCSMLVHGWGVGMHPFNHPDKNLDGNSIDVRNGGAGIAIAGTVRVDRGGVGLLLARHAEIGEDTRVMLQPTGAAALGVGFGAGLLAALVLCRTCMRRRNGAS